MVGLGEAHGVAPGGGDAQGQAKTKTLSARREPPGPSPTKNLGQDPRTPNSRQLPEDHTGRELWGGQRWSS